MKLTETVSWLMEGLQGSFSHPLQRCYETRLTVQEQRLIKILEVVEVE